MTDQEVDSQTRSRRRPRLICANLHFPLGNIEDQICPKCGSEFKIAVPPKADYLLTWAERAALVPWGVPQLTREELEKMLGYPHVFPSERAAALAKKKAEEEAKQKEAEKVKQEEETGGKIK